MMDPNIQDFYMRVARIESARAHGYGFEASGTLGRSYYRRAPRKSFPVLKPLLVVALSVILLKAMIHYNIGNDIYAARVAELQAGQGLDRLGGYLMAPDPVMLWLSTEMTERMPRGL